MKYFTLGIIIFCFGCPSATSLKDGGYTMVAKHKAHWNKEDFPIVVAVDQFIDYQSKDKFVKAIKQWNKSVSTEDEPVFVVQFLDLKEPYLQNVCGFIIISIEQIHGEPFNKPPEWDAYHIGYSHKDGQGRFCRGRIRVDTDMPIEWHKEIMVHELGHGLGLAHDDENMMSIMYPIIRGIPIPQVIMKDDAEKIKKMMNGSWTQESP